MGAALYKSLFPNDTPKLALLNIGSEEVKGTEVLKKTYTKLYLVTIAIHSFQLNLHRRIQLKEEF